MEDVRFLYNVPYDSNQWYVALTTSTHFYFNSVTKRSFWQISDLDVDKQQFVKSINFDEIGLLTAKINGLDIEPYLKRDHKDTKPRERTSAEKIHDAREEDRREREDIGEEREKRNEEKDVEIETSISEEEVDDKKLDSRLTGVAPIGLDLGYSSEDSEEEAELQSEAETSARPEQPASSQASGDESEPGSESESDINAGLDLSVTDESSPDEFYRLLDTFKSQISVYDPWFLVESELISDFATHPEFYSIDESQREKFYDIWVKEQSTKEAGKFPTPTQLYLKFLQSHKDQLKKLFFPDFKNMFIKDNEFVAATTNLSSKQVENLFRSYKLFLNDFAEYEKAQKKKQQASKINLKKKKLDDFLHHHLSSISEAVANSAATSVPQPLSSHSDFENWTSLCNAFNLPSSVCDDIVNYVVGDEKRYQSYYDAVKQCMR